MSSVDFSGTYKLPQFPCNSREGNNDRIGLKKNKCEIFYTGVGALGVAYTLYV